MSIYVISRRSQAKPTKVFNAYWRFAVERQRIFHARSCGHAYHTPDRILAEYKFTNAYRASDRTSQYLIREVIYAGDPQPREVFFRTVLFKLFNRIETWELIRQTLGEVRVDEFDVTRYQRLLDVALKCGKRIYTAAYIMPSGGRDARFLRKHHMHLALLKRMMDEDLPDRLLDCRSMREAFLQLRAYPSIGDFLAFQLVTDLNYSEHWNYSEMEFVVAGPGSRDGVAKCFRDRGELTVEDLIRAVAEQQDREFGRLGLRFQDLWGRPLQLIDCQNLFCEISKYARIAFPDVRGTSQRKRVKQRYSPHPEMIANWYPPKWSINEHIPPRVERAEHGRTCPLGT